VLGVTAYGQSIASVTLSPTNVVGGSSAKGTVTLSAAAPASGLVVTLASTSASATVAASAKVAANATTATFSVKTVAVAKNATATISASAGISKKSATLTITAPTLKTVTLSPTSLIGGINSTGTFTISSAAPAGGLSIAVSSSSSSAKVTSPVMVAAGATKATFPVTTTPVPAKVVATIKGTLGSSSIGVPLTINPPTLTSLTIDPTTVVSGTPATGTVVLSGAAPSAGIKVTLKSSQKFATVDPSVTVPGGQTSVTFLIQTSYVYPANKASISATALGTTHSAVLTVTPGNALSSGPWPKAYANNQNTSSNGAPNAKGKLKWSVDFYGGFYTPLAYGKGEVATVEFATTESLLIFDVTGTLLHKIALAAINVSPPVAGPDGSFYVMTEKGLDGFRTNGAVKFTLPIANASPQTPIVSSTGTIFVGADNKLYAVNANGTVKWNLAGYSPSLAGPTGSIYAISAHGIALISSTGAVRWDHPFALGSTCAAVGPDGGLFVKTSDPSQNNKPFLQALNIDGSTRYIWATPGISTVGSDGVLYNVEQGGAAQPWAIQAVSIEGKSLWRHTLPGYSPGAPAWSISMRPDGTILVSNNANVLAYTPSGTRLWIVTPVHLIVSTPVSAEDGSVYLAAKLDGARFDIVNRPGNACFSVLRVTPEGKRDWTFHGGGLAAAPAIGGDGTLYAPLVSGVLQTLHPDGSLGWPYLADAPISTTPTIGADGTVYFTSMEGTVYALSSTGTKKWSYHTGGWVFGGIALSSDATLYVVSQIGLVALDLSGHLKWVIKDVANLGESTPAISPGGTIYYGAGGEGFRAVNPDGTIKWTASKNCNSTPVVLPNGQIQADADGLGRLFNPDGTFPFNFLIPYSGQPPIVSSSFDGFIFTGRNGAVGVSSSGVKWKDDEGSNLAYGSASGFGMLYVPGSSGTIGTVLSDGQLYAVDPSTGHLIWTLPVIQADSFATSIGADGTVYVVSTDGFLYAVG